MENFEFFNPVKIIFGKGVIGKLSSQIPVDANVLVTYGMGSIKKNGIYNQVMASLKDFNTFEFGGIEPNPTYETCLKGLEVIKTNNIDFLLAVGGGSVIDGTKFMAAATRYSGDNSWDIVAKGLPIGSAIPLGTVLTLPATGTEMNANSVITKKKTLDKLAFRSPYIMPKFSVLDPEATYSLPMRQIVNGVIDAFVHVMEQYLTYPVNSPVQDRMAEGILQTLVEEGLKAYKNKNPDYENRANIMWAATMALNGLIGLGVKSDWSTHIIGHELTAFHGLDHAVTLAIVLPGVMNQKKQARKEKILQYGERVWQITEGSETDRLNKTIEKTESFFNELGVPTKLSAYNIGDDTIDRIIKRLKERGMEKIGMQQDISLEEVRKILKSQK